MPIQIIRNDITRVRADAIVNAANGRLAPGGGVCGAIHAAAGPELAEECSRLGGCATGQAKITRGYRLPSRYVIHTVGPVWQGGQSGERDALTSCYISSLRLARANGCRSVAFPLISAGIYGYPADQAMRVAMDAIRDYLLSIDDDMEVWMVVFSRESVRIGARLTDSLRQYIDDHYVDAHRDSRRRMAPRPSLRIEDSQMPGHRPAPSQMPLMEAVYCEPADSLEEALGQIDEGFSGMVLRKIAEKGMKNADCYKKANLDRKLFSKISNDPHYHPKKPTALALAVALELSLAETRELLLKAGLALSPSEKFDIIVEFFISHGNYDIFEINEALFTYDQPPLGVG